MKYWETEEYLADQAAFEAGGQSKEEIFAVAQKWGIEAKVAATEKYADMHRIDYLCRSAYHYIEQWKAVGLEDLLVGRVLEVGCGVASFLEVLPRVTEALALDPALGAYVERLPDKARIGRHGKCFYFSGTIDTIVRLIGKGYFDAAFSHNAIDHGIDWEDIIRNIAWALKPGGNLLLGVHVCDKPRTGYHRRLTHPSHFSIEALNSELEENRLEILWQSPIPEPRVPVWFSYTWARRQT